MTEENKNEKSCKMSCRGSQDGFVDSIEKEIRTENWQMIWQKYGKILVISFGIAVLFVSVYGAWKKNVAAENNAISAQFSILQNMIISGKTEEALPKIKQLSGIRNKDYANLAKLEHAAILRLKNDKEALSVYQSIFKDPKSSVIVRELAYILYVNASLDLMPTKEIISNLDSFVTELSGKYSKSVWSMLAKESLAFCYIKLGKNDLAKQTLESLATTAEVPAGITERARVVLQFIDR